MWRKEGGRIRVMTWAARKINYSEGHDANNALSPFLLGSKEALDGCQPYNSRDPIKVAVEAVDHFYA